MGENLRSYSRLLTAQLKEKEEELADLKSRFSKVQNRFAQLDYAFKKNLELHQRQIIEIHKLRNSQKGLRRVDENRWKEFRELEEQLMRVTKEKEVAKNGLAYWKQATIDEKKFHEGKYEEFIKVCNLRLQEERTILKNELTESETLARNHVQQLINLKKEEDEKVEAIRKKAIVLQGDVDVLKYRTDELARLFETLPQTNQSLKAICSCIVEVLRSFSFSHDEYNEKMKELHRALIEKNSVPKFEQKNEESSDYESLKNQNLVLREVVKKLKNDLTQLKKNEAIVSYPIAIEKSRTNQSKEELDQYMMDNKKLRDLLVEKNNEMRKLKTEKKKLERKFEIDLEMISKTNNSNDNNDKRKLNNGGTMTANKFVQTEEILVMKYFENEESQEFDNDDETLEAYWVLKEKQVENVDERTSRDEMKSLKLNLGSSDFIRGTSERKEVTVEDKQKFIENIETDINPKNIEYPELGISRGRFEPVESHLNSIRYKEYTIPFSKRDNLKVRHPISNEKIIQLLSVKTEKEYRHTPANEAVLYFNFENVDVEPFSKIKSRLTNCGVQTVPIRTENVFSQTIITKESLSMTGGGTGIKMLNSEKRAIERGLRDLEKTISEASKETLEEARAIIISSAKFPPSEEFFDCIRYLSKSFGDA